MAAGLNCSTDQIIRWDDTNDVWVCATDPLANLSCSAGDTLTYDGAAFTCACVPPGTAIDDSNFRTAIADWLSKGNASEYGDITKWCTGFVTDMAEAFDGRTEFNEDIGDWDTSNAYTMRNMFYDAGSFNQNISGWDTSNVFDMSAMFYQANTFNQPIGGWDTSSVVDMSYMFDSAAAFNQDLSDWVVPLLSGCSRFAREATARLAAYSGAIAGKTPPLSASMIAAGCGN